MDDYSNVRIPLNPLPGELTERQQEAIEWAVRTAFAEIFLKDWTWDDVNREWIKKN